MSGVKVNGVDLELLRKEVKKGYNPSSATVVALIQIALAEPALREELAAERYALEKATAYLARVMAARVTLGREAVIGVVDEIIKKYIDVKPLRTKGKVH